jgi:hypothetical protein
MKSEEISSDSIDSMLGEDESFADILSDMVPDLDIKKFLRDTANSCATVASRMFGYNIDFHILQQIKETYKQCSDYMKEKVGITDPTLDL